jgi:nitrogen fixation protein NifT
MKVMIRKMPSGAFSAYIAKKDLEEPIVANDREGLWGGVVILANGWKLELPEMAADTRLPITVEAAFFLWERFRHPFQKHRLNW